MENNPDIITTKKRSLILSAVLSIMSPGLGQLYNGRLLWSFAILLASLFIDKFFEFTALFRSFYLFIIYLIISAIIYIFAIVHSIRLAKHNVNYQLKSYNRVFIYILFGILTYGISKWIPKNPIVESLTIPTTGMENTLMCGENIMADKNYYKSNKVKRNDLAVFEVDSIHGKSSKGLLIKRAIAFEGETISIKNGIIYINGQKYQYNNPNIIYESGPYKDFPETVVPKNNIFFIGDNRSNSLDSRYFGTIPVNMVKGKPLYVYFSLSIKRIGIELE